MIKKAFFCTVAVCLFALGSVWSQSEDTTVLAPPINDGPYVYWKAPSEAIVFYLCADTLQKHTVTGTDTVRFTGYCTDTGVTYAIPVTPPEIQPDVHDGVSRVFAVSDLHGWYDMFVAMLQGAGVVDDNLNWTWGDGHLVVNGDVFDRGAYVNEILWLIYRLEQEALSAGVRVHLTLGNHELMVIRGDNRYVNEKYIDGIARKTRIKPEDLYGPDMELGRWLRTKHTAIKINDILFVHGGIEPGAVERGLTIRDINEIARAHLDDRSYARAFDEDVRYFYGSLGPFWYRGYFDESKKYAKATQQDLIAVLAHFGAESVVVGHTGVDRVESLYDGLVYAIDIPEDDPALWQGLLWEKGRFYRVFASGKREVIE